MVLMIIGSEIIFREELTSTNSHANNLLASGDLPEGTIIRAGFQSAGRGQPGNRWESEKDKNLLISLILYPKNIDPSQQFLVSMTISLGIYDFIRRFVPATSIKWPNDIYINSDKIAGILIESSVMSNEIKYLIAGLGININQEHFTSDAPNPVSLKQLTGIDYDLRECIKILAEDLNARYLALKNGRIERLSSDYHSCLFRKDEWAMFSDPDGIFEGKINQVVTDGRISIETRSGKLKKFYFKEVEYIPGNHDN
jgi:BirA family biotin operon repressor/biotin-[acetyl-CoA-carboxylase] ligase